MRFEIKKTGTGRYVVVCTHTGKKQAYDSASFLEAVAMRDSMNRLPAYEQIREVNEHFAGTK